MTAAPPQSDDPVGTVMVVGGGIAGMQAALDLGDSGFEVVLVERSSAVGGRMVQLDKTFPTNDCSMCTISPRLVRLGMHPNVKLWTHAELCALEGQAPRLQATVRRRAAYVDVDRCTACGECVATCPVETPDPFNQALGTRAAIFRSYPQAQPNAYAIDKRGTAPCRAACPAHVHVAGYVALIRQGKLAEAVELIRRDLPLPSVCGRVCSHPCEQACRRDDDDEAVAIRALKRYATDAAAAEPASFPPSAPRREDDRVAVVGSGPAGLSAAAFLAREGCAVTLFEALDEPGGWLATGVPAFRLPREVLRAEIDAILSLGVELRTGVRVGRDRSLNQLLADGFRAVFLAPGLRRGRALDLEGGELDGVVQGIELLGAVARGEPLSSRGRAIVIGGGNVAVDVARTLVRIGDEQVTVVCLEQPDELPAGPEEVADAVDEGVTFFHGWGPRRLLGDGGRLGAVELRACTRCYDAEGRFDPRYDEQERRRLPADRVVLAVGQSLEPGLAPQLGLADERLLSVDPVTLETAVPNVFAGGDATTGPATVIEAVAAGRRAAAAIAARLRGEQLATDWPGLAPVVVDEERRERARPGSRVSEPKRAAASRRRDFDEAVAALSGEQAVAEANRCLSCSVCVECHRCETVCPAQAIDHAARDTEQRLDVGAVVLAPGLAMFDPKLRGEYGYGRYPNVLTGLDVERLLSSSGPTGGELLRPSDGEPPRSIAWLQCIGSRDERSGRTYCSAVCCTYATKQARLAREHDPDVETTVFFLDMRTYGKGFDAYFESAKSRYGVQYVRALVSSLEEVPETGQLELRYRSEDGTLHTRQFDMVVLSTGMSPSAEVRQLVERCGVAVDAHGFARTDLCDPGRTERPGVVVAGSLAGPRDIPDTVASASSAAALCQALLAPARGSRVVEVELPPERDVSGEPPRIGVFVCRCGTNIARVVDVPALVRHAAALPNVVHAEENLYTCSVDTQRRIAEAVVEHRLNRVVVASCTPRTHEPLFRQTMRRAGLNPYLFEMANIRDQCSWVHAHLPVQAQDKARDLTHMAVARARWLQPLRERSVAVEPGALVLGGGVAGLSCALALAEQGFETTVVEREAEAGGHLRRLGRLEDGSEPQALLGSLLDRARSSGRVQLLTGAELQRTDGHVGAFQSRVRLADGSDSIVQHGVTVVAVGAQPYEPEGQYGYGTDPRVITQDQLERRLAARARSDGQAPERVVMIQCVGSRTDDFPVCSRVCCTRAVENARWLKERCPATEVLVLYRDLRTYGLRDGSYRAARRAGVLFVRYEPDAPPQVAPGADQVRVAVDDPTLRRPLELGADLVVLSTGIRPPADAPQLASLLAVPLGSDGFFQEAHAKLRPVDCPSEGLFLCGHAQGPRALDEVIAQARAAAARAARVLAQPELRVSGEVSVVDADCCAACLTCVRVCPYQVPRIGDEGTAVIEPASCQGCGTCAAACPQNAITTGHWACDQLLAKVDALYDADVGPGRLPAAPPRDSTAGRDDSSNEKEREVRP